MRRLVGTISLTLFAILTAVHTTKAVDFGGIAARPANPTSDERTSAWFVYTAPAGWSREDALIVENNSDQKKTYDLYPADSTPTTGDGFALKQKAEKMDAVGSWVELKTNSATIAPHEKATIPFTVTVPKNTAPGLYAGGIMVAENTAAEQGNGINLNLRVGVRMYVTVVAASGNVDGLLPHSNLNRSLTTGALVAVLLAVAVAYMAVVLKRKR